MPVVAYQGEPGAFSWLAARYFFGATVKTSPFEAFSGVFDFVSSKPSRVGIVPIENSIYGSIHQNYDLLQSHGLFIIGEIYLRIRLQLMSVPTTSFRNIKYIYSQAQALGQCDQFLRAMKSAKIMPFHDTAGAARMIRDEQRSDAAAIASSAAAKVYDLKILRKNVESNEKNFTRFLVLSKKKVNPATAEKTSLVFALRNTPGSLFNALQAFAREKVNLTKIESRPMIGKPWEYLFYLDAEGTTRSGRFRQSLEELRHNSDFVRVLGEYKRGRVYSS